MDAITHVLAGYTLGLILFRDARMAGLTALGALAPDLDVLLAPLTLLEPFWYLQHRGATHSLVGAPLWALLVVRVVGTVGQRWRRLQPLAWQRRAPYAAVLGGFSHLVLDGPTHHGAPWLWPFSDAPASPEIYHWMIIWLAPFSLAVLVARYRRRISDRAVRQAMAGILAAIIVMGGVRLAERPDGEHVFSRANPYEWIVAQRADNGSWEVNSIVDGRVEETFWFEDHVPAGGEAALAALRASIPYRSFQMDGFGLEAVHVQQRGDGWQVQITDVVRASEARLLPAWVPAKRIEEESVLRAIVGDGVRILD